MNSTARVATAAKGTLVRSLFSLPAPAIRKMAGPPVTVEGNVMDPEIQLLLKAQKAEGPPAEDLPIDKGRVAIVEGASMVGGNLPIGAVTDRTIEGPGGNLTLRFYTPRGMTETAPTLLFIHGGGWIYGNLDSHDAVCRFLAEEAGVRVVAVDYRLAPESRFPAAYDDVVVAWKWIVDHAEGLGVDVERLAIGGDSAGGNLAAVVAQQALREEFQPPAFQLLIYPATDFVEEAASRTTFAEGFFLSKKFMDLARENYLSEGADPADPRLSPLRHDPSGVAPAYLVTAGFDPLRDEGKAYADAMHDAGVQVEYVCETGLIHSFANMVSIGTAGPEAMSRAAKALARALAR